MKRSLLSIAVIFALCFSSPWVFGQRGKEGVKSGKGAEHQNTGAKKSPNENKSGGKPPGGQWSEGPGKKSPSNQNPHQNSEAKHNPNQASGAEKAAAADQDKSPASGAQGAAAGVAAANRNKAPASGKEGAAAGAAAANRNSPAASGAQGAALGAAAANRNNPAASGAQGAALGAAAANRNNSNLSGVQGAALGAAAANQNSSAIAGGTGAVSVPERYNAVRDSFDHPSLYNQQWYSGHPEAWGTNNWSAGNIWTGTNQAGVAAYCNYPNAGLSYGYGDNVTNQNGDVLIDGKPVGTAEEFSQQASDLASIGQNAKPSPKDQWLSLGVFAVVRNEDQHAQITVQLAINKQGILQGNYTDLVSDHTLAIHGSVDKETQRAAWTVGNNKNFFMEAGLNNLTSGESPALIHKFNRTEKWLLIRLPNPESEEVAATEPNLSK